MDQPLFPDVRVQLTGQDGNAFFIIGRVTKAARAAKVPKDSIDDYINEAMSGDYDHLLQVTMKYFTVNDLDTPLDCDIINHRLEAKGDYPYRRL